MIDPDDSNPLDARLRALPLRQMSEARARRAHARAASLFEKSRRVPTSIAIERVWSRTLFPAVLAATVIAYLAWAIHRATLFYS